MSNYKSLYKTNPSKGNKLVLKDYEKKKGKKNSRKREK